MEDLNPVKDPKDVKSKNKKWKLGLKTNINWKKIKSIHKFTVKKLRKTDRY